MVLPSDATLRLIQWLAHREPEQLLTLATLRGLRAQDLASLTTLALALNDGACVSRALVGLSRAQLGQLDDVARGTHPGGALPELSALGLVDDSEVPPQLLCGASQLPPLPAHSSEPAGAATATSALGAEALLRAGTQSATLLCYLDDLVQVIHRGPLPITREGSPSVSTQKLLIEILGDTFEPTMLVKLLVLAGLVTPSKTELTLCAYANIWQDLNPEDQWSALALAWWASTPTWLQSILRRFPAANWSGELEALVEHHYPLLQGLGDLTEWRAQASALGVILEGTPTPWGLALWDGAASVELAQYLPSPVAGVYANEDFTLLAPGPLTPQHRRTLDRLTTKELGGLVPRYRLTSSALLEALQAGEEPEGIAAALQETSQNPLPAGMVQLIQDTIRHSENIRLHAAGKGTIVRVKTPQLAQELVADPALVALSLHVEQPSVLFTPWPMERVHHALTTSRYVALMTLEPASPSAPDDPEHATLNPLAQAATALAASISTARQQGIAPWLGSMVEVATEHKIPLEIECEIPGGQVITMLMEPRSLSNGRLRGLDVKNAMEKTIPVSSIREIKPSTYTPEPR